MAYTGTQQEGDPDAPSVGLLITNLGTPDAPTRKALRPYLKQFLSDPRVVEIPRLLWWFILNGIILNVRPAQSAAAYSSIWTDEGSPLLVNTRKQCEALQALLGPEIKVDFAMRYGNPSIDDALQRLLDSGVRQLLVIPLYPQYSGPTTGSTFDALAADFLNRRWVPELRFVNTYCRHPGYIGALAKSIQHHWDANGRADKLILSFHGEPKSYRDRGDPYYDQCVETTRLVTAQLGLSESEYELTFQSRFGNEEWLQPYTDERLKALPAEGVKSVQVICPGFSADCLETLEEIAEENCEYFVEAGGENYQYIPCLNDSREHLEALYEIARENLVGWIQPGIQEPLATASA